MQNLPIGEVIRQKRVALGLSQAELCSGICEPPTLSRIENGRQTPSRTTLNALLQRLDLPEDRYYALTSDHEAEIESLKKDIIACNVLERVDEGFEKLAKLETLIDPDDHLERQFVLRSRALLGRLDGRYSPEKVLELSLQAIRLTVPQFDLERVGDFVYTYDEVKIINQIAVTYSNLGEHEKAADIFNQLLKYIQNHYHEVLSSTGMLPMVLYNYARVLDLCGDYEAGAKYAELCRQNCVNYGHYQSLPLCLAIYAECCHFMGKEKESLKAYIESYILMETLNDFHNINQVKKELSEYHHFDADMIFPS